MTPEAEDRILKAIRLGLHPNRAAQVHGIPASTMRAHRKRNPEFATRVREAEASAEASFLSRIVKHTEKNWTACAWLMERRWAKRWGRVEASDVSVKMDSNVKIEGPPAPQDPKVLADYITTFAAAAAMIRRDDNEPTSTDPSAGA